MTTPGDERGDETGEILLLRAALAAAEARIAHLESMLHAANRARFGQSAERVDPGQLVLALGREFPPQPANDAPRPERPRTPAGVRRNRGSLPPHLERVERVVEPASRACPCCGRAMHRVGEDRSERLDVVPARLRVLDNGDRSSFASVEISVSGPTPTVTMTASFTSLLAPATVTYTIDVSGVVPVAWEWDFEGDGFLDAASSTTNSATTTYRVAAAFIARGFVVDREGRRFRTNGASLIISPGVAPPTITSPLSATATSGSLPFRTNFSVTATGATKFEWDFDGDGRYDQDTGSSSSVVHQYERVGTVTATVRATNASGTSVTSTLGISVTQPATAGWLVEPRRGERITGTSVSLFAEVVPRGRMKKVQFQFRRDGSSDPWSDIGGAVYSEGTRFSTNWNVSAFTELSAFDLRILIDDSVSSGDDDNQVTISASPFDISESGNGKDRLLSASLTTFLRNSAGVEAVVPYESMTSGTTAILRLEPGATFPPNGSTLGGTQFGSSFRLSVVSGSATFRNSIIVRLPIPSGSASSLFEVHRYDEAAGVWRKDEASDVRASEGLVETRTTGLGVFAIFRVSDDGGEDGSNFCFASATHRRAPIPVLFGFLCFIFWRLWRSWRSSSRPAGSSPAKRS